VVDPTASPPVAGKFFPENPYALSRGTNCEKQSEEAYDPQPVQEDYVKAAAILWTRPEQVRACASDDRSLDGSLKLLSKLYNEIRTPVVIVTGDSDLLVNPRNMPSGCTALSEARN